MQVLHSLRLDDDLLEKESSVESNKRSHGCARHVEPFKVFRQYANLPDNQVQPSASVGHSNFSSESNGQSPRTTRLASSGPIQNSGGVFNSRMKSSATNAVTPAPRTLTSDPRSSSKTTGMKASRPSRRNQTGRKSVMALPYRGPTIGCAATMSTHSRTSFGRIWRCRIPTRTPLHATLEVDWWSIRAVVYSTVAFNTSGD